MKNSYYYTSALIFTLLLLPALDFYSQDYAPLVEGDTSFYSGPYSRYAQSYEEDILGVRIDSSREINGSIVYYLNKTWNLTNSSCVKPNGNSWLGPHFIKSDGGVYYFFNQNGDTIEIRTLAEPGEKWRMLNFPDGGFIDAEATKIAYENFLGLDDSLKYISMTEYVKNHDNPSVYDSVNQRSLIISKHHGFVSVVNFNDLYKNKQSYEEHWPEVFHITGKTNPKAGKTFISTADIYNFDLGDEFHYESGDSYPPYHSYHQYLIKKVTGRSYSAKMDTIYYTFQVRKKHEYNDYVKKTKTDSISVYSSIENHYITTIYYLPNEPIVKPLIIYGMIWDEYSYSLEINSSVNNRRTFTPSYDVYNKENDSCWKWVHPHGAPTYMDGCGMFSTFDDMYFFDKLVYFKKGSETWGKPLTITSVDESSPFADVLTVYPNPAEDVLFVNGSPDCPVQVFSPEGIKLLEATSGCRIDVGGLAPGIYFARQGGHAVKFIKR